jgi:hypothetical protein
VSSYQDVRRIALALPEAVEQDHHGIASFRVRGRIFATVPDPEHVRVMFGEQEILAAVSEHPATCSPLYWGKRLACLVVLTADAPAELLRELLTDAWLRKAPKALAAQLPSPPT